jgi:hypothetical protein
VKITTTKDSHDGLEVGQNYNKNMFKFRFKLQAQIQNKAMIYSIKINSNTILSKTWNDWEHEKEEQG